MDLNQRLPRIDSSRFAMVPRADIPRSTFITTHSHKTTFDFGYLVPIYVGEVIPADTWRGDVQVFARMATPVFPVMDAMQLETFFFFVPARLIWGNWKRFMGERNNPGDSISYTIPKIWLPANGYPVGTIFDYFGLPVQGHAVFTGLYYGNALPLRAYNFIWNEWFRDQNLQSTVSVPTDDGPDSDAAYTLKRRNKRHDYFTSALTYPVKGGVDVTLPMGGIAPVKGIASTSTAAITAGSPTGQETGGTSSTAWTHYFTTTGNLLVKSAGSSTGSAPSIYADLTGATGATINALRTAVATQRILERDARSGTRYTELLQAHFGVRPEDSRLQRPEYIGGGRTSIQTQAIPQTSASTITGSGTQLGSLGAAAVASDRHSFAYSATEHGYIIGLAHATADITYQQGVNRLFTRSTRLDFYLPEFAHLGEQAIRNDELYFTGTLATDAGVFGYQERWSELRYEASRTTGLMRSTSSGNIDEWHAAQQFTALPLLNDAFIQDQPPISRILAAGTAANGMQLIFDSSFRIKKVRPLPMFSVPGNMDRL